MTYYIDSVLGNDENDGQSRQSAFKTVDRINSLVLSGGDRVLFKSGCNYPGNLKPMRNRDGVTIEITGYGAGEKPCIVSCSGEAIDLCDFDNVEISGLRLTNREGIRGIFIRNQSGGELKHIHIKQCDIENINVSHEEFAYESGGIICGSFSDIPGWFDDLLLEDNRIFDVCKTGILLTGFWGNRPHKRWGRNEYISDSENWWPSTGVKIRGNYIDETGGDGIVLIGTAGALIEWNTVYNVMTRPKYPSANAGIWPQSSNDCLIQYNEVGYSHKPEGYNDAQGFDVDIACRNTVIRYNYSHDNEGGFLLLCDDSASPETDGFTGTVVHDNLSVNDGKVKGELIALVGPVRGAVIKNNILYSTGSVDRIVEIWTSDGSNQAKDILFKDNTFICNGKSNRHNLANGENIRFECNKYWGTHKVPPAEDKTGRTQDPCLIKPGSTGKGMQVMSDYEPKG